MTIKSYTNKTRKDHIIMIRLDKKQANLHLIHIVGLDSKVVDKMNPTEINTALEECSMIEGKASMCLKGTREATNISFSSKETQATYKEAETMVSGLARFVGKDGLKYECGVYCKKVVVKKEATKK
jgi:predicted MPP superfamily phosphohydrolase